MYAAYATILFLVLAIITLLINLFLPGLRARRRVAGKLSRLFLRLAGISLTVRGIERLPSTACIVVANHSSYIDGIVAVAALPPDFAFVIKKEMLRVPLAGMMLRRLGSQFVERFDRHKGASDARRVLRLAASGQSLVFFPEGTFDEHRHIRKFLGGAFAIALRSNLPVVPVIFRGPWEVMPATGIMLYRRPLVVEILAVLPPDGARQRSRDIIAAALGEPLAP